MPQLSATVISWMPLIVCIFVVSFCRAMAKTKSKAKSRATKPKVQRMRGGGDGDAVGGASAWTQVMPWVWFLTAVGMAVGLFFAFRMWSASRHRPMVVVVDAGGRGLPPMTSSNPFVTPSPPATPVNSTIPIYPERDPVYQPPSTQNAYQQVGVLTETNVAPPAQPMLLPLYARKIRSDRLQYFVGSDRMFALRLPVQSGTRDCTDDNGCGELYNGDTVTVPSYDGRTFQVTLYKLGF